MSPLLLRNIPYSRPVVAPTNRFASGPMWPIMPLAEAERGVMMWVAQAGWLVIPLAAAALPMGMVIGIALSRRRAAGQSGDQAAQIAQELGLLIDGAVNHAIYMLDPQGRVTLWNTGAERIKGWREEDVLGRHCALFYTADDVAAGKPDEDLRHAAQLGRLEEECWRARADGTEFLAEVTITALRDDQGRLVGFGKLVRDITDRRAAESAIEAREMQLRSILATVPDAMIVINDRGIITSFSTTAQNLFGYSEGDVIGRNISMLMPSPDREAHDGYIIRYLATGERRIIGTTRRVMGLRQDGSVFPLELAIGEAIGGGRRVFTGVIRDLTRKEATEAQLRELQAELLHVSRISAMGTMASTLAHELNQPITAIANYMEAAADLIDRQDADALELVREALGEAASEALRAGSIVRRLREFVSRGDVEKSKEALAPLIEEACTLGLAGAQESGVSRRFEFDRSVGDVLIDRVQIQQVLINLLRNAVEAMAPTGGGEVTIITRRKGGLARITIADNGPGLDPAIASQLFQAFVSTKRDGMGLGLSICRTIVEAHGGRIWAEPRPGGGTLFHLTLQHMEEDNG